MNRKKQTVSSILPQENEREVWEKANRARKSSKEQVWNAFYGWIPPNPTHHEDGMCGERGRENVKQDLRRDGILCPEYNVLHRFGTVDALTLHN